MAYSAGSSRSGHAEIGAERRECGFDERTIPDTLGERTIERVRRDRAALTFQRCEVMGPFENATKIVKCG